MDGVDHYYTMLVKKREYLAMAKYLIDMQGFDASNRDEKGNTSLNVAAFSGSLDILTYLIEEKKCSPKCSGQCGRSPLHHVCSKNENLVMVKYLVEKHGCDPSGKDDDGDTSLHLAAFSGSLNILMYLIEERKCSPECPGELGRSLLHNACSKNGNLAMVKYLVEKHGCGLFVHDIYGRTPLDLATTWNNGLVIQYLSSRLGTHTPIHFVSLYIGA